MTTITRPQKGSSTPLRNGNRHACNHRRLPKKGTMTRQQLVAVMMSGLVICICNYYYWLFQSYQSAWDVPKWIDYPSKFLSTGEVVFDANITCVEPRKEPKYTWTFYSKMQDASSSNMNFHLRPRNSKTMIVQYIPWDYHPSLHWIVTLTKLYAQRWSLDYVLVQGITMTLPILDGMDCEPQDTQDKIRLAFNKIEMLRFGLRQKHSYDQMVLLDSYTFLGELDRDVTTLMSPTDTSKLLAASGSGINTVNDIYATIWNLHHKSLPAIISMWQSEASHALNSLRFKQNLELSLPQNANRERRSLGEHIRNMILPTDLSTFQSAIARILPFFQRQIVHPPNSDLREGIVRNYPNKDDRVEHVDKFVAQLCFQLKVDHQYDCLKELCPRSYRFNRPPKWDWRLYSQNVTSSNNNKRVLVAQYSAFGSYARLLEQTSPVNKAYAKYWGYDFLTLQGSTIRVARDSWCTPEEQRSRFNKISILQHAMSADYDILFLLDADAMVYNLSKPVHEYLLDDPTIMLTALRVTADEPQRGTWNINNGVTVWNLRHEYTPQVVQGWYDTTIHFLGRNPSRHVYSIRGDQAILHMVIRNPPYSTAINTVLHEFLYHAGTSVRHFIRQFLDFSKDDVWNATMIDQRFVGITKSAEEACAKHTHVCSDELEHTIYTN